MRYLNDIAFRHKMNNIQRRNISKERRMILKTEKNKYKKERKFISTSKLILLIVIVLCLQIIAFTEYVMIKFNDTSALYVLIGVPATLVPTIWGYYAKSKAENTANGIVYETALKQMEINNNVDSDEDDEFQSD